MCLLSTNLDEFCALDSLLDAVSYVLLSLENSARDSEHAWHWLYLVEWTAVEFELSVQSGNSDRFRQSDPAAAVQQLAQSSSEQVLLVRY